MTLLWSGLNAFIQGIISLFYKFFHSISEESFKDFSVNEDQLRMMNEGISLIRTGGRLYFTLNAILFFLSFLGALKMWQLEKNGFHLYTIAQILMLILPLIFITGFQMPGINVLLTVVFILAYAGFLKYMH